MTERLTDDEADQIRQALKRWLPVSYEGAMKYLEPAVRSILEPRVRQAYEDGESSGYADWIIAIGEHLPDDFEPTPSNIGAAIGRLWNMPHEDWCCANGCTHMHGPECPGCTCLVSTVRAQVIPPTQDTL